MEIFDLTAFPGPRVEQIVAAIRAAIASRQLRPGSRLPSIRQFAANHSVSTFTVVDAYDRLSALGEVVARKGDGFYVAQRAAKPGRAAPAMPAQAIDAFWLIDSSFIPADDAAQPGSGWLPADWFDQQGLARALRQVAKGNGPSTRYGDALGWLPLRQWLAGQYQDAAIPARAEQILLTHGASQALRLIVAALLAAGDVVLVDDPGYCNLITLLKQAGIRVVGVPWTAQGPDAAALAQLMAQHSPKVFFTNSRLQNPTGASYSDASAFRVLKLAEQYDCWVVEDDVSFGLVPGREGSLAALDGLERVIHVGSFSKTLAPSLRVGYVAAEPAVIEALLHHKMVSDLTTSELAEQLVLAMASDSGARRRLNRLRERLLAANQSARAVLERLGWQVYGELSASLFVWVRLPEGRDDAVACAEAALAEGLLLAPGVLFRTERLATPWLRCNVAYCDEHLFTFLQRWGQG